MAYKLPWLRRRQTVHAATHHPALLAYTNLTYAVGDIHGCDRLLGTLLEKILADIQTQRCEYGFQGEVKIIFLGDYIDRGLESKDVITRLLHLTETAKTRHISCLFLLGNHERTLLDFLQKPEIGIQWAQFGGIETLAAYGVRVPQFCSDLHVWQQAQLAFKAALPTTHRTFLETLALYHIDPPFMFVHAGIDPDLPLAQQGEAEFLWIRHTFLEARIPLPYVIVHGHTPEPEPVWNGQRIGLDMGAYMSGHLTAGRIHKSQISFIST